MSVVPTAWGLTSKGDPMIPRDPDPVQPVTSGSGDVVYGSSTVKRPRRTKGQLSDLDSLIIAVVEDDYPVSLRGVYYRVVSAGGIPKTEAGYRVIGRQLLKLRRAHRIPYNRIADGTRWVIRPASHDSLEDCLEATADLYRRNLWNEQDVDVHIFTEKDAISGVVSSVTATWNVPLGVLRGFASETFAFEMAEAIQRSRKPTYVYQLGDHDPSGVAAWEDFQRKVMDFASDTEIYFERIAVTPEQIEEFGLPTRPTKRTDTRAAGFVGESVEVDAIPARTLRAIVNDAIEQHIDPGEVHRLEIVEEQERDLLYRLAGQVGDHD
jgi:hypothetical protein